MTAVEMELKLVKKEPQYINVRLHKLEQGVGNLIKADFFEKMFHLKDYDAEMAE